MLQDMVVDELEDVEPGALERVLGVDEVGRAQQAVLVALLGDPEGVLGLLDLDLLDLQLLLGRPARSERSGLDLDGHAPLEVRPPDLDGLQRGFGLGDLGLRPEPVEGRVADRQGGRPVAAGSFRCRA